MIPRILQLQLLLLLLAPFVICDNQKGSLRNAGGLRSLRGWISTAASDHPPQNQHQHSIYAASSRASTPVLASNTHSLVEDAFDNLGGRRGLLQPETSESPTKPPPTLMAVVRSPGPPRPPPSTSSQPTPAALPRPPTPPRPPPRSSPPPSPVKPPSPSPRASPPPPRRPPPPPNKNPVSPPSAALDAPLSPPGSPATPPSPRPPPFPRKSPPPPAPPPHPPPPRRPPSPPRSPPPPPIIRPPSPPPVPVRALGGSNLSDVDANAILDLHNYWRAQHNVPPLKWDTKLASSAQLWADNCFFEHSPWAMGENLGIGPPLKIVNLWYEEVCLYNYSNPRFNETTGHFTQLVWAGTTAVGCAIGNCPYGTMDVTGFMWRKPYLVCEYWPPGNVYQQYTANVPPLSTSGDNVCADSDNSRRKLVEGDAVIRASGKLHSGFAGSVRVQQQAPGNEMMVGLAKESVTTQPDV